MLPSTFNRYQLFYLIIVAMFFSCQRKSNDQLSASNQNSDSIQYYLKKSNNNYNDKKYDSAFLYDKKLFRYAQLYEYDHYQGTALFNIGYYFDEIKKVPDSAFFYYNASTYYYKKDRDSSRVGSNLVNMAIIQKNRNDYFGAKETLTEALRYLSNGKNKKFKASVYDQLGTNNIKLFNYSDAITYYRKAIETTNSDRDVLSYKNNLATVHIEDKNYVLAVKILKDLIKDSLLLKRPVLKARVIHNLAYANWKSDKNFQSKMFFEALKIRKSNKDFRGQIASHTDLGEYFLSIEPERSKKHLDTVIQLSKRLKIPQAELDALKLMMELSPKDVIIRDRYVFLKDSMYLQELKVKTQFAKLKYDDQLKLEAIQKLEVETVKKNAQLKQQRWQKLLFIIVSLFILLAAVILYFFIRERNKKQQLQLVYSTERRLSKKIHDELANEVFGVMNTVQHNIQASKEKLVDKLDAIYKKTRDISKTSNYRTTEVNFKQEVKELLNDYQNDDVSIVVKGLEQDIFTSLSIHKKEALILVLQEILVNSKKHSKASLIGITFSKTPKKLTVNYKDNGIGVDLKEKERNGLQNMGIRIQNVGGRFTFVSQPGDGVKITFSIPF